MIKKTTALLFLLAVIGSIWLFNSIYRSATEIVVVQHTLETDFSEDIRMVHLADLHSYEFGENNSELVWLVKQQNPDIILLTGDMMDKADENTDVVCGLIEELSQIADVYYGYGNHEYEWMNRHNENLTTLLSESGATVLDIEYTDVTVNGQLLRIGGYHGYYRQPGMYDIPVEQRQKELAFAAEFEETERYKILLSHIPTAWLDWRYIDRFPVNLVLCGHYHGGQIVLPFLGGVYAPYVGLFPEYTDGLYVGAEATCILSAGLGCGSWIPRVNNLPQIVVVDLKAG